VIKNAGGILLFRLFFVLLSVICAQNLLATPIDNILKQRGTQTKSYDYEIGEQIQLVLKNKLKASEMKALKRRVRVNKRFRLLSTWLNQVEKIDKSHNTASLKNHCKTNNKLPLVFRRHTEKKCRKHFTQLTSKRKLSGPERNYLKDQLYHYIFTDREVSHFTSYLKELFKKDSISQKLLSKKIVELYKARSIGIPLKLYRVIEIDKKTRKALGKARLLPVQSKKKYVKSMSKKYRSIIRSVNKKKYSQYTLNKTVRDIINYYQKNINHISRRRANNFLFSLGNVLRRNKEYYNSYKLYQAVRRSNGGEPKFLADYEIIWSKLSQNKNTSAYQYIKDRSLLKNFGKLPVKLKFWIAYTLKQNKKENHFNVYAKKIIKNHPLSFYSVLLYESGINNELHKVDILKDVKHLTASEAAKHSLARLKVWSHIGDLGLVNSEVRYLSQIAPKNLLTKINTSNGLTKKAIPYLLAAKVLSNEENYLGSFQQIYSALARKTMPASMSLITTLFPKSFYNEIKKQTRDVNPLIVLSLIRQESAFNPKAKSRVGARGLMQLMPKTAQQMKRRVKKKQLFDPKLNIKLGVRYLTQLFKKYDGNLVHTLAAYNAGETNLKRWRKTHFSSDKLIMNIESIPFKETRTYVKLIMRNIYFYNMLLNKGSDSSKPKELFQVVANF